MHQVIEAAERWLAVAAHRTCEALNSWLGHRLEVAAVGLLLLVVSFTFAHFIGKGVDLPYRQLSGAKLKNVGDADKRTSRLKKLRGHRFRFIGKVVRSLGLFTLFAFVLPSAILAAGIYFYDWFIPKGAALAQQAGCDSWAAAHPNPETLLLFVLSQFMMGFGHSLELLVPQSHSIATAGALNPTSGIVGLALTGYRYFVAGFAAVFFNYLRKIVSLFRLINPEETRLATMN